MIELDKTPFWLVFLTQDSENIPSPCAEMVISMSPIQFSLETDVPGMGGFCYKDLLKTNLIDYFIGQFYTDFTLDAYKECVNNGYPTEKLVIGMITI